MDATRAKSLSIGRGLVKKVHCVSLLVMMSIVALI